MASIQKRGGSYRIRVSCGYAANGRQITRSMTWTPPAGYNAKQIERELKRVAYEFESRVDGGGYENSTVKVADFAHDWLAANNTRLSPKTLINYQYTIDILISEIGHMRLADVKPGHIQRFINILEGRISAATVRSNLIPVCAMFSHAIRQGIISENPASSNRLILPKVKSKETDIYTKDELAEMLTALDGASETLRTLVHLAINTGMRRGELAGLMWDDIDFNTAIINIRRAAISLPEEGTIYKEPKTSSSVRRITIPEYVAEMLRQLHLHQTADRFEMGDLWKGDGKYVFTGPLGRPLAPETITMRWVYFLSTNNLPHHKFHALRHTSASYLLNSGADIKTVAARLGHTQLATTQRYLHTITDADKAAAEKIGGMIEDIKTMAK